MINKFDNLFFIVLDDTNKVELVSDKFKLYYSITDSMKIIEKTLKEGIIFLFNTQIKKKEKFLLTRNKKDNQTYICLTLLDDVSINSICSLTNLPNRTALINYLNTINDEFELFICLMNLDDFSSINDVYGGVIGDEILKNISVFLVKTLKSYKIFKLRDDEFAIVSTNNNLEVHVSFLKKIISSYFNKPFYTEEGEILIGSTAVFTCDLPSAVLKNANETLKYAKINKKSFLIYTEDII